MYSTSKQIYYINYKILKKKNYFNEDVSNDSIETTTFKEYRLYFRTFYVWLSTTVDYVDETPTDTSQFFSCIKRPAGTK